jgi:hypothetical protein
MKILRATQEDETSLSKPIPKRAEIRARETKEGWKEWRKLRRLRKIAAAAGITCGLLLAAQVGTAGELAGPPKPKAHAGTAGTTHSPKPSLKTSLAIAGVGLAADLGTTAYGLARHGDRVSEANPAGPVLASALAVGGCVAGIVILHRGGHERAGRVMGWVCGGVHAGLAIHNVRVIRQR